MSKYFDGIGLGRAPWERARGAAVPPVEADFAEPTTGPAALPPPPRYEEALALNRQSFGLLLERAARSDLIGLALALYDHCKEIEGAKAAQSSYVYILERHLAAQQREGGETWAVEVTPSQLGSITQEPDAGGESKLIDLEKYRAGR